MRVLIARVACSCEILVKNRLEPARPAGRPRAKPHREISILAPFFEVQKMDISGAYSKQYHGYACSSGRLLLPARFRRPVLLVLLVIMIRLPPVCECVFFVFVVVAKRLLTKQISAKSIYMELPHGGKGGKRGGEKKFSAYLERYTSSGEF